MVYSLCMYYDRRQITGLVCSFDATRLYPCIQCMAQDVMTTAHPERTEFESFAFNFDGATGLLAVHQKDVCYLWKLTEAEHDQIHTDGGLRNVEVRVLNEIENAEYTVVPKEILHPSLFFSCSHQAKHFYLVH